MDMQDFLGRGLAGDAACTPRSYLRSFGNGNGGLAFLPRHHADGIRVAVSSNATLTSVLCIAFGHAGILVCVAGMRFGYIPSMSNQRDAPRSPTDPGQKDRGRRGVAPGRQLVAVIELTGHRPDVLSLHRAALHGG